jgi:hypothetical protein
MTQVDFSKVPEFYHNYIKLVNDLSLLEAFQIHSGECVDFFESISEEKSSYRYEVGKWSIKEVLQHIIDAERIFAYRALCFARKEQTSLPGFEENEYAAHSAADKRSWHDIVEEFKVVRKSTELLFQSFDKEQLNMEGVANNNPIQVAAIGFITVGHCLHHLNIIRERYL